LTKSITYVAVVGAVLALTAANAGEAGTTPVPAAPEAAAGPYTVTLLTGDRVSLADPAGEHLSVRPGPGRTGMRFAVVRTGGGVYVIPGDELAQVRAGTVDRRLFDVAGLARAGYRDARVAPAAAVGEAGAVDAAPTSTAEEGYDLTIRFLDRNGSPTQDAFASVAGWDQSIADWPVVDAAGTATVRLPEGRYNLGAYLGSGPDTALLVQPVVDLTRDLTVTLDARAAKPVTLTVPEPSAQIGFIETGYSFYPSYQSWAAGLLLIGDGVSGVRMGQVGAPAAPEALIGSMAAQWAKPDGADDFTDSPYLYAVSETFPGRMPDGYTRDYRAGEFAAVRQRFATTAPAQSAISMEFPSYTPALASVTALNVPTTLPGTRVEYLHTGTSWTSDLWLGVRDEDGRFDPQGRLYREPTDYRASGSYRDEWNAGPAGPAFGQAGESAWQWASRTGDRIRVDLPLYGDRAGHAGSLVPTDSARTALYRDGELVGEFPWSGSGSFTVPPETAGYRLEVADTRATGDLTTAVSAQWTFRSGHADGDQPARLPLAAVRFTPRLDANNAAPAGRTFELPVKVEGQPGAPAAPVAQLTVEVSYDDGATWSRAPLRTAGSGWIATVRHPRQDGYVSLRATATDTSGTGVTETIIHAYRLTVG